MIKATGIWRRWVTLKLGVGEPEDLGRRMCLNREWSWYGDLHWTAVSAHNLVLPREGVTAWVTSWNHTGWA